MNNMKQTILGLFVALILMTASCSNDEKNEPTTYDPATEIAVGYSQDKSEYVLAAINENGTITKSGNISYTGTCSVNGEKGYTFTFIGYKEK